MGRYTLLTGRVLRAAGLVAVLLFSGLLPRLGPAIVSAQDYEAMMPETLHREWQKAEKDYRVAIDAVNTAETERISRKAAGAGADELRALDDTVGRLVNKAEKLKVQADYLDEIYQTKEREYKSR